MYLYNCTVVVINDPVIIDNEKKIFTIIFHVILIMKQVNTIN